MNAFQPHFERLRLKTASNWLKNLLVRQKRQRHAIFDLWPAYLLPKQLLN
jgi:hypothetical protein